MVGKIQMKKLLLVILYVSLSNVYGQKILHNTVQTDANQSVIVNGTDNGKSEDEINRIIVEFKDIPDILLPKVLRKNGINHNRSAQLVEYLLGISKKFNKSLNKNLSLTILINKEFHKAFSGVQLEVPRKYISYIAGLDYVKKIHIDNQVHIYLDESVPLIKADKVWTTLNNKGKGIKISIIDTGIDYFHDALGQGYGVNYKVIYGYDFVNRDSDPMDDNGHGTHVAGIVAANSSTLKGVAPEASLVACKVLDATGNGYSSTIIEAIEYSIDPNNDGDFSDAVDVINLSVGGYGTPDDPLATAVNNASAIGVVVCTAAGNDGDLGFYTIGSPGCAEKAITVGNSTKSETLASSSATGPTINNFFIKPDVLAPGTNIKSCKLSGGTIVYSGTSMASPHVAGICALLKKQHPEWTPDEMKAAIKTTAQILMYEPMQQGSGFVDAYKAITVGTLVVPADLNFGKCDTTNSFWNPHKNLKIKNISPTTQNYSVSISSTYPGISFIVDKPSFSVSSGDSTAIDIQMSVNNSIVPFNNSGSNSYSAYARIAGTKDTLSLPWAFVKRQMIQLKFEMPNSIFILATTDKLYQPSEATYTDLYTAELNVPNGNYDFMSGMRMSDTTYICIKKNLNLTGADVITISKNESKNEIHIDGKDEYGRHFVDLPEYYYSLMLFNKRKFPHALSFFGKSWNYFISDIPESHILHCYQYSTDGDSVYRAISFKPVSNYVSDIIFTNKPEDLVKRKVRLLYDNKVITSAVTFGLYNLFTNDVGQTLEGIDGGGKIIPIANKYWEGYVVRNEQTDDNPDFKFSLNALNSYPPNPWSYSFVSAPMRVKNKQFFMGPTNEITPDIFIEEDPTRPFIIGDDIVFAKAEYTMKWNYISQRIYFTGQMGDSRDCSGNIYYYKIYDANNLIIDSGHTEIFDQISSFQGPHLKTQYYQVGHSRFADSSIAMLTSVFGKGESNLAPPSLTSLQFRNSSGRPADSVGKFENTQLRFSLKNPNLNEQSVKVEIKDYHATTWSAYTPVKIAVHDSIGSLFALQLDSSKCKFIRLLSVKISYADNSGNSGEWLLDPALKINRENHYAPKLTAIGDRTILEDDTLSIRVYCTDLDNDPIFYRLKAKNSHPTFETNDTLVKIIPEPNWHGTDEICLIASDGELSDSTTFTLHVTSVNDRPGNFQLVNPHNAYRLELNGGNKNDSLSFSWSRSTDVDGDGLLYRMYLFADSTIIDSVVTSANTFKYPYSHFSKLLIDNQKDSLVLRWSVCVSDGIDAVSAGNNPYEFVISNRTTDVKDEKLPTTYCLYNAYPNPFNPTTVIEYDIKESTDVKLNVYDTQGRIVRVLVDRKQNMGTYRVTFNASQLPSGVYFYTLRTKNYSNTKKMILIR